MQGQFKLCPLCQNAWPLDQVRCHNCGHMFRTNFTGKGPQPTQPFAAPIIPSVAPAVQPKQGWLTTPRAVVLAALIVLSPALIIGGACALGALERAARTARRPSVADTLNTIRFGTKRDRVIELLGQPDATSRTGGIDRPPIDTYSYELRDGGVEITIMYGAVQDIVPN